MTERLAGLAAEYGEKVAGVDPAGIVMGMSRVEAALGRYDSAATPAADLRGEFAAMVRLYRAVRDADSVMQSLLRSSEVAEQLLRVYYALRTVQAAITMRYAIEGRSAEAPETSPVGTAIGLFDAPKVLAQETHLASGSYDADLSRFVAWMREIWTDIGVRQADYVRFYGEADLEAAAASLRGILDLGPSGEARLRDFSAGGAHDPVILVDRLTGWAGEGADLVSAARAIQEAGEAARSSLLSLIAHRDAYDAQLGANTVGEIEAMLGDALRWRFPVGETPLFDLAAEQDAFDDLLARVPTGHGAVLLPAEPWYALVDAALRRVCLVEQSLRDHAEEYRTRHSDARRRRSLRWYVWEFVSLLDRAGQQRSLGARSQKWT